MSKKKRLTYGVGINDADYQVQDCIITVDENGKKSRKVIWRCPFYSKWVSMLRRCYHHKYQEKQPTYKGCSVFEEWLLFSNFKAWMETQDWEGKHLDKDLLVMGNKIYSPETCVFVDAKINLFLTDCNASRGQHMIGVYWSKPNKKFKASCNDGSGKLKYLGYFNTELEAHQAWLKCKQEMALKLADEQTDPRVAKALIDRYENYVVQEKEMA